MTASKFQRQIRDFRWWRARLKCSRQRTTTRNCKRGKQFMVIHDLIHDLLIIRFVYLWCTIDCRTLKRSADEHEPWMNWMIFYDEFSFKNCPTLIFVCQTETYIIPTSGCNRRRPRAVDLSLEQWWRDSLVQCCPTCGPRAACGPWRHSVWPAKAHKNFRQWGPIQCPFL